MLELLYKLGFRKYIDYHIVGDYLDTDDGVHYIKKYIKKYYLKKKGNLNYGINICTKRHFTD